MPNGTLRKHIRAGTSEFIEELQAGWNRHIPGREILQEAASAWIGINTFFYLGVLLSVAGFSLFFNLEGEPTAIDFIRSISLLIGVWGVIILTSFAGLIYVRSLLLLRDGAVYFWDKYTYVNTAEKPRRSSRTTHSLREITGRVLRQGLYATAASLLIVFGVINGEKISGVQLGEVANYPIVKEIASVIQVLPPFGALGAAASLILPNQMSDALTLTIYIGVPALLFAVPVRNALYAFEEFWHRMLEDFHDFPTESKIIIIGTGLALSVSGPYVSFILYLNFA